MNGIPEMSAFSVPIDVCGSASGGMIPFVYIPTVCKVDPMAPSGRTGRPTSYLGHCCNGMRSMKKNTAKPNGSPAIPRGASGPSRPNKASLRL